MSGFLGDLSPEQAAALDEFRTRLADALMPEVHEDRYLLRFLRARKWSVDKANDMFRDTLQFRAKWHLDTILKDYKPPAVVVDYFPWGTLSGPTKNGQVVLWLALGQTDIRGLLSACSIEELTRYKLYRMEELEAMARATPRWQITAVSDMQGLSSKHLYRPGMKYFADTERMVEDYYPELLAKVHVIHAPRIFNMMWEMIRHAFDPVTQSKFEVVAGDPLPHLVEYIDKDVLPTYVGGTREYPDHRQLSLGGTVPKALYKTVDESYTHVVVPAGAHHVHKTTVAAHGTSLAWDFTVEEHDIGFTVYHVPQGVDEYDRTAHAVIHASERSHEHSECIHLDKTGEYHLVWDNSYSWVHRKHLAYKIEVILPGERVTSARASA